MRRPLLLLLACLCLVACGERPSHGSLPPGAKVLAFGDSITHGTGAARGEDFPSQLASLTGWQIINAGIPGDTAQAANGRLAPLLDEHQPALVLVELGGNDFLRRRPPAQVKEDLRSILRQVKQRAIPVVLVAVPRLSVLRATVGALDDDALYGELAKEEGIPLVADLLSGILSREALRADAVHPNAQGYSALAKGLYSDLSAMGFVAP